MQDILIYVCKGISLYGEKLKEQGTVDKNVARFVGKALFATNTNVAGDDDVIIARIKEGLNVWDTVILTAGCAKYRYKKLALGDIGGIPRVLDAGQCNDSYSLAVIALKLKEAFDSALPCQLFCLLMWPKSRLINLILNQLIKLKQILRQ